MGLGLAFIFLALLFLKTIWPSDIYLPKLDLFSWILIALASFSILAHTYASRLLRFFRTTKPSVLSRYFVTFFCLVLILMRMMFPQITFDNMSLYLFIIAILILIVPDFKDLLLKVRKFKKGDLELEFGEEMVRLVSKTKEVEERLEKDSDKLTDQEDALFGFSGEVVQRLADAAADPRGVLLVLAVEIESRIRRLAQNAQIADASKPISVHKLLEQLAERKIVSWDFINLFRDFWTVRNNVVHNVHFQVNEGRLYELAELGVRVLKLLPGEITSHKPAKKSQAPD